MYRTPIISSYFVRDIAMTKPALLKDHAADTAESVDADLGCLGETLSLRRGGQNSKSLWCCVLSHSQLLTKYVEI